MASISNLCSRCIVVDKGNVVFDGEVENAIDFYYKSINSFITKNLLKNRTDRKGLGQVKFLNVDVLGSKKSTINCGDILK